MENSMILKQADWIKAPGDFGDICPVFRKPFALPKKAADATLLISAIGVYEAEINGKRVGDFVMAPGWTDYKHRVQYQEYDVLELLGDKNTLEITLGKGWSGEFTWFQNRGYPEYPSPAVICALKLGYADGSSDVILSGEGFEAAKSNILFSDIYDGEVFDARHCEREWTPAPVADYPKDILIPQQGEYVREIEEIKPAELVRTLAGGGRKVGEKIIDFGRNITGYVKFRTCLPEGSVIEIRHAEVLREGGSARFYTDNLRNALQKITYIAGGGQAEYKTHFTFQGFRYIRLDKWAGDVDPDDFTAVVVHSDIRRTGYFECSNEKVNKLFQNIIWTQRGNFLDVPTDCPQRDERCGWTGDAQIFIRAATYNFDVAKFFEKWLADMALEQFEDGGIPAIVPNTLGELYANNAAWGDAAVICPWQVYLTYGDKRILTAQFGCMRKWVDFLREEAGESLTWPEGFYFGDWLALDNGEGAFEGATPHDFIATAFFAYSARLLIKAGKVLGADMGRYEELYANIVYAFQNRYITGGELAVKTQTAHAVALKFGLCGDAKENIAKDLAGLVAANGDKLNTGFIGTPYLLHALSENGYAETAYSLLLREDYPSWLYSVNKGATTIWEHWDGIKEDGSFWDPDMNSFSHYAYGAVADWMYGAICGIDTDEDAPGFENAILRPLPDRRLDHAKASIDTKFGTLSSGWSFDGDTVIYEFEVPNRATVVIGGRICEVGKGVHRFVSCGDGTLSRVSRTTDTGNGQ